MKYIILVISLLLLMFASNAYCWDCAPKSCQFDIECGIQCWCYKGTYEIEGTCVSE